MRWVEQLFARRRRYDELSQSIQEHLEEKIADLVDRGMTREEAERTARGEFGNLTLIEQRSREVWQWPTLESILADLRFGLRQFRKAPGFADHRDSRRCARHRRQRDHLHLCQRRLAQTAAVPGPIAPGCRIRADQHLL